MGTRHVTIVKVDGEIKVAQYGQWDGYPSGQGAVVLEFLQRFNRDIFLEKVRQCRFIENEKVREYWKSVGAVNDFVDWPISQKFKKKYRQLHRDTGANVLWLIQESENGLELKNDYAFAGDSLICEWAYFIDFDENVFEVYRGNNMEPLHPTERFSELGSQQFHEKTFYPVKIFWRCSLDHLPPENYMACLEWDIGEMLRNQTKDDKEKQSPSEPSLNGTA